MLEGVAYSLHTHPDPELDARLDEIVDNIRRSQEPDGYLNTWFSVKEPQKRWQNLQHAHELYCAGHMFEAAVAHYRDPRVAAAGLDIRTKRLHYDLLGTDDRISLTGLLHSVDVFDRALSAQEVSVRHNAKRGLFPGPLTLTAGPYVRHLARNKA